MGMLPIISACRTQVRDTQQQQHTTQGIGTMSTTTTIRVTGKDFKYATAFLKKRGFTFNSASKTWSGSGDASFLIEEKYVIPVLVSESPIDQILMGMGHENSIH
jgi:hypothetical protein